MLLVVELLMVLVEVELVAERQDKAEALEQLVKEITEAVDQIVVLLLAEAAVVELELLEQEQMLLVVVQGVVDVTVAVLE
tara:strand:+ start:257 stop:496 length:240 start_codon:yes stop_codon:yes gene_type:complete